MVVGLGIVAAPAAHAADPVAPNVTVTAPSQISNNWATGGSHSKQEFTVEVKNNDSTNAQTMQYQLTMTVPDGVQCSDITLAAGPAADFSGPAGDVFFGVPADGSVVSFTNALSGSNPTCTYTGPASENLSAGADDTWAFTIEVKTEDTPGNFAGAAPTGDVTLEVAANYGTSENVTASDTSELVSPGPATVAESAPVAPEFGSQYSQQLFSDPGFPATNEYSNSDSTDHLYTATPYTKDSNGDWTAGTPRAVQFDNGGGFTAATFTDAAVAVDGTNGANGSVYISLADNATDFTNDVVTPATSTTPDHLTGFYFDTNTQSVVYGTVTVTGTNANTADLFAGTNFKFTAKPVKERDTAGKDTWIVTANNGAGDSKTVDTDLDGIQVTHPDYASHAFNLSVGFSDVDPDSVFIDAINTLSGTTPPVIKGFGDGTFHPTEDVTRGQFSAYAVRMLQTQGTVANPITAYKCDSDNPSAFTDVATAGTFCVDIKVLNNLDVINGYADGTFRPNEKITRAQLAAYVFRLNAAVLKVQVNDAAPTSTDFVDVPANAWYSGDVAWASDNNIINGRDDTHFDPSGVATRQVSGAMLYRFGTFQGWFN